MWPYIDLLDKISHCDKFSFDWVILCKFVTASKIDIQLELPAILFNDEVWGISYCLAHLDDLVDKIDFKKGSCRPVNVFWLKDPHCEAKGSWVTVKVV